MRGSNKEEKGDATFQAKSELLPAEEAVDKGQKAVAFGRISGVLTTLFQLVSKGQGGQIFRVLDENNVNDLLVMDCRDLIAQWVTYQSGGLSGKMSLVSNISFCCSSSVTVLANKLSCLLLVTLLTLC